MQTQPEDHLLGIVGCAMGIEVHDCDSVKMKFGDAQNYVPADYIRQRWIFLFAHRAFVKCQDSDG